MTVKRHTNLLVVTAGIVMLVFLWIVFGCKDKAEATEHIEGQIVWLDKMYIFNGSDYIPVSKNEISDPVDITLVLDEPETISLVLDNPAYQAIYDRALSAEEIAEINRKISVPDEPELLTIIIPDDPESTWKCSCGQGFGEMLEVFCSCGKAYKTFDIIMKCIPTWPDYIELEKDLIIIWPKEILKYTDADYGETEWNYQPKVFMAKGTKIYFKEDK